MKKILKAIKWLLLLTGTMVAILGITLIFTPFENFSALGVYIGLAMIFTGISEMASFFGKEKGKRTYAMPANGAVSVLLGTWIVFGSGIDMISLVLPFAFTVWIMSASIPRIINALSHRKKGSPWWVWLFGFGVLGIAFGFLILFHRQLAAFVVVYSLAFMFITHGINSVTIFFRLNKPKPEYGTDSEIHEKVNK
ncbi:MAG: DUF308 domain-containing protein [Defluviitaleaceae bacterium]|nr:DUF308 domain-containing protein [Defluviitaleaceae bacterium]MCL2835444.1 DUF308 domain-containing protein [Defluviitaleaceae bacterium]